MYLEHVFSGIGTRERDVYSPFESAETTSLALKELG